MTRVAFDDARPPVASRRPASRRSNRREHARPARSATRARRKHAPLGSTRLHGNPGRAEIQELAHTPQPFRALYEHWERHQWSPFTIDFSTDAASFAALDERTRDDLVLVFAHRFHAEFNVAGLLAPFLLAAPDYDVQLALATQVADEHRHIESVLRVYSDVFAVEGGVAEVKALADAQLDPVSAALYAALEDVVRALEASRDEDSFLRAIVAYHLIGEGSIGRANQNFVAAQFERVGSFPGLREAQRRAVRDEVRHIGIGIAYTRRRLAREGARARALIEEVVEGFHALGDSLLAHAPPDLLHDFASAYGDEPAALWAEVRHQLELRLRSIGFSDVPSEHSIKLRP